MRGCSFYIKAWDSTVNTDIAAHLQIWLIVDPLGGVPALHVTQDHYELRPSHSLRVLQSS